MVKRTFYEFDGFRLDGSKGEFIRDGHVIALRAKPFELLLTLVENHGRAVAKEELLKRVWPGITAADSTFHVTLDSVRKALGETGREPHYIIRTAAGYKFVANVREISASDEKIAGLERVEAVRVPGHAAHLITVGLLYGGYHVVSLLIEVAYQFDRFGRSALRIAPLVFVGMATSTVVSLKLDRRLTQDGRVNGLLASVVCLLLTAVLLFGFMTRFLPAFPVTESFLQTYPAQAAFLKNTSYIVLLTILFASLPFHFIVAKDRRLERGKNYEVGADERLPKQRLPYWSFWTLAILLLVFLVMSVAMTARLVDNLKPNPYHNLFVQLVYLRALLFFGLGITCLTWYFRALERLKT
ncbi:MAG: winged helix-turn-helix domain-containing protein [Pyrinomonadaceae bacterium]